MANIPVSFSRSVTLAALVSCITVVFAVARPDSAFVESSATARASYSQLQSPVSSIYRGFWSDSVSVSAFNSSVSIPASLYISAWGANHFWTLPFGLFAMFAVVKTDANRAWEEAAADLGASAWQRLR